MFAWWIPEWIIGVCALVGALGLLTYILPVLYQSFFLGPPQDFREKYNAKWALVTGGSSGIGEAIVHRLAKQKIHVVVVALDDAYLEAAMARFREAYPSITFKAVPVNLGAEESEAYMRPIREATQGLEDWRLLFNNAGFLQPGLFDQVPIERQATNLHCNATSSVHLTHYFLNQLNLQSAHSSADSTSVGGKGLVAFTSSSAGFLPTPLSALYGATKCFLTSFACSLATEMREEGVDVLCIHPSPIRSNFYQTSEKSKLSLITQFKATACGPDVIAETIWKAAGRCLVRDQGYFSIGTKLMLKCLDWNALSACAPLFMERHPDFRRLKAEKMERIGNMQNKVRKEYQLGNKEE